MDFDYFYYRSQWHFIALMITGWTSSLLSLFGSGTVVYLIVTQKEDRGVYHRLLLGLSCIDIIVTTSFVLQPIFTRSDINLPLAVGNVSTCEALAFFGWIFGLFRFLAFTSCVMILICLRRVLGVYVAVGMQFFIASLSNRLIEKQSR